MSKNTHLRQEAGGDPSRAVSTDLKNQPKAPHDGNDFPDSPAQAADDTPQDKPDLEAFAKRMGTDTIETGESLDAVTEHVVAGDVTAGRDAPDSNAPDEDAADGDAVDDSTRQRMIIAAGGAVVAAILLLVVKRRRKQHHLVAKAMSLAAAARAIRS